MRKQRQKFGNTRGNLLGNTGVTLYHPSSDGVGGHPIFGISSSDQKFYEAEVLDVETF